MNDVLRVARHADYLELTLNRPARRNALSHALIRALTDTLRAAAADRDVRTVILTGQPPAFCAGLDLGEVAQTGAHAYDTSALAALYETIETLPQPVIAAVRGAAMAGGATLAVVSDISICALSAQIGYPGIRHGLVAPIVMPSLRRAVGEVRARYLLLTGDTLTGEQAARWGLVTRAVPDDQLLTCVREVAATLSLHAPAALTDTKRLLRALRGVDDAEAFRKLADTVPLTDAARAGLAAFLDR
jgi:methylglutaconyl-CoA hydratase